MYRANVDDYGGQVSLNLTTTIKVEVMNFAKFTFEFEFVPFLFGLGTSMYTNSALGDNCSWMHAEFQALALRTRVTKNIKRCGKNLKTTILEGQSWE